MMWNIQFENRTDYLLETSFLLGNFLTDYEFFKNILIRDSKEIGR